MFFEQILKFDGWFLQARPIMVQCWFIEKT